MPNLYTQLAELADSHDAIRAELVAEGVSAAATHGFTRFAGDIETLADSYDADIDALEDELENMQIVVEGTVSGAYANDIITQVGKHVFRGNTDITSVSMENVVSVGSYAFNGCTSLTSIYLPNMTTVGAYSFATTGITSAVLDKLEVVTSNSFNTCSSLSSIELPSATQLSSNCFANCASLSSLDLSSPDRDTIPVMTHVNCLSGTPIESGTGYIYFNDDGVDTLKAAPNFSTYAAQIKPVSEKPA